jgi:hypothetical protein
MFYKACPKCLGDLHIEPDLMGKGPPDLICLQCGRCLSRDEREAIFSQRGMNAGGKNARGTERQRSAA